MQKTVTSRKNPILLISFVLLVFVAFMFFWQFHRLISLTEWVDHTDQVIAKTNLIERQTIDIEASTRGYVITGDVDFLKPYRHALTELPSQLEILKNLVNDNPRQLERINQASVLLLKLENYYTDVIKRKSTNRDTSLLIKTGRGNQQVASIRELLEEVVSDEEALKVKRTAFVQIGVRGIYVSLIISFLFLAMVVYQSLKSRRKMVAEQTGALENFRRMATVIQDSNDAITFQDLEGNILAWNRGAEVMYGYSESEALRMNIVDTVPSEYQEEARGFLASLKRGELLPNLETKRKTKNGQIIDVWLTNTKLTDDKGILTGIATTERDITVQTKTLEKFRRMATVIQDSNDAITFQDLEGNILAWNRGAEIMYGYSEAEALSKNIVDTVPPEYQEEARGFLASLKRGELVPTLETKRKTKDGRIVDVWLTNTKLTDDKGALTGIATTERDISSQIGALEKFRRMATVIQDSNDAITFQDLEGNILAWNRGAEKIYGYSETEALSKNIVDTVPTEL